jgi:adenine/guanine phosphoribosyltransferase-like PRPP-binding protein
MWPSPIDLVAPLVGSLLPWTLLACLLYNDAACRAIMTSSAPLKEVEAWHFVLLSVWYRSADKARDALFKWYKCANFLVDFEAGFGMSMGAMLGSSIYFALVIMPAFHKYTMMLFFPLMVLGCLVGRSFRRRIFFFTSTEFVKAVLHSRTATELGNVNRVFNQVLFGAVGHEGLSINSYDSSTSHWQDLHNALAAAVAQSKPLLEQALKDHVGFLNGRATLTREDIDEFFTRVWCQFLFGSQKHPALARPSAFDPRKSTYQAAREQREWPELRLELFKNMHQALKRLLLTEFHDRSKLRYLFSSTSTTFASSTTAAAVAASIQRASIFEDIETLMQSVKDWRLRLSLSNLEGQLNNFIDTKVENGDPKTPSDDAKTFQGIVDQAKDLRHLLKTEIPASARVASADVASNASSVDVDVDAPVSFADAFDQQLSKRYPDSEDAKTDGSNLGEMFRSRTLRDNMVLAVLVLDFVRTVELEWLLSVTNTVTISPGPVPAPVAKPDAIDKWPKLRRALTKGFFFPWRMRRVVQPIVLTTDVATAAALRATENTGTRSMHDLFAAPSASSASVNFAPAVPTTPATVPLAQESKSGPTGAHLLEIKKNQFSLVPGDLVMINLVDSGFFFSTGPRSCVGKSAFLWIHEFFAEHVRPQVSSRWKDDDDTKVVVAVDSNGDSKTDQLRDLHPASLQPTVDGATAAKKTTLDDHPASFVDVKVSPASTKPCTAGDARSDERVDLASHYPSMRANFLQLDPRNPHAATLPKHVGSATWTRTFSRQYLKNTLEASEFKGVKSFFNVLDIHRRPAVVDYMVSCFVHHLAISGLEFDAFASPESRGWLITGDLCATSRDPITGARRPIHTIRKAGKLPPGVKSGLVRASYATSYSAAELKQQQAAESKDSKSPPQSLLQAPAEQILEMVGSPDLAGQRIVLVDDGISGGGTVLACASLLEQCGAKIVLVFCPLNHSYAKRKPEFVERFESRGLLLTCFDM